MGEHGGTSFSQKHGTGITANETIREAVLAHGKDDALPCALAFRIAEDLDVSPGDVGIGVDLLNYRLTKCQMGLFGYQPNKKIVTPLEDVPGALKDAIDSALVDGRLSCESAWKVAKGCGVSKMTVSGACEVLGVKVKPCQLGAF